MKIITKRFLLRDFIQEDEPAFLAYHADSRYAEFCSLEEVTPDFTHELFQRFMQWATEVLDAIINWRSSIAAIYG